MERKARSRHIAAWLLLVMLTAGCTSPGNGAGSITDPRVDPQETTWHRWPDQAVFMNIKISCACQGNLELGGLFTANWSAAPTPNGPSARVPEATYADWFQWTVYQDQRDGILTLRQYALGIGVAQEYLGMADAGAGPAVGATVARAEGGEVRVGYEQNFPYIVPLEDGPVHLVLVATNETSLRQAPELDLRIEAPAAADVVAKVGYNALFVYDQPSFGRGQAVDASAPPGMHVRNFGRSSLEVESAGPFIFGIIPWGPAGGISEATYAIEAPDHEFRVRYNETNGQYGYTCLEGCSGLGRAYDLNTGMAPAGSTNLVIEEARCAGQDRCRGMVVGVDLGDSTLAAPGAPER